MRDNQTPSATPLPRCQVAEPAAMSRLVPDSTDTCARPEQSGPRQNRPRRAAAVEADRRRKTWLEDLN